MARIDSFLRLVVSQKASDLHFLAGSPPTVRHDGELVPIPFRAVGEDEAKRFLFEILTEKQRAEFERHQNLDFAYPLPGAGRFRTNMFVHRQGLGAVFRIVPERVPDLDELGLPRSLFDLSRLGNGLVLFTGPTGCGKTTTQAALVGEINRSRSVHVITIEDPIEFIHQPNQSVITQRQVGLHVRSWADALRSALRESPDVLLVGEMRDFETISLAVRAAETGVLVFGTLHTSGAAQSISRVLDVYPDDQIDQVRGVLSVVLRAVVAQRLVKLASGAGRVAAIEILRGNVAVGNMIREGKIHQVESMLQSMDPSSGMQSMDRSLLELVRRRLVTFEQALEHVRYPQVFARTAEEERIGPES